MIDEALFQRQLQRYPGAWPVRLLFGEWLAERGDWRSAGYLWMGRHRKEPSPSHQTWDWWRPRAVCRYEIKLPDWLWDLLAAPPHGGFPNCKEFRNRRAAEEALCEALNRSAAQPPS